MRPFGLRKDTAAEAAGTPVFQALPGEPLLNAGAAV
jgi:hypothetical protein